MYSFFFFGSVTTLILMRPQSSKFWERFLKGLGFDPKMWSSYNTIDGAFAFGNMVWCHVAKLCNWGLIQLGFNTTMPLTFLVEDDTLTFLVEDEALRPVPKYCPVVSPHSLGFSVLTFHKAFCVIMFNPPPHDLCWKMNILKFADSPIWWSGFLTFYACPCCWVVISVTSFC